MANKKKISVPLTFNDIPLVDLAKWDEKEYMDLQLVHIFSGMSRDELRTLPQSHIETTSVHLRKMLSTPSQVHTKRLTIKGTEYGFINDWTELTSGEYVDICQYVEEPLINATKLMAIFYRPILEDWGSTNPEGAGYKIAPYKGTKGHEIFNDVSASNFYGAIDFFLSTIMDSAITSLQYLESQAIAITKTTKLEKKKWYEKLLSTLFPKDGRGMTS